MLTKRDTPLHVEEVRRWADVRRSIHSTLQHERAVGGSSWADCFKMGENKALQRIGTGMLIQAVSQLSGINFIFYCELPDECRQLTAQTARPFFSTLASRTRSSSRSISHAPVEYTSPEECAIGAEVLFQAVMKWDAQRQH